MTTEKFGNEILDDEDLDEVSGGNIGDRTIASLWVQHYYGQNGGTHGKLIDTSSGNANEIMANFCAKAGIEFKPSESGFDQFKIDGEWRDALWLANNKQAALDYFDKKLGIK